MIYKIPNYILINLQVKRKEKLQATKFGGKRRQKFIIQARKRSTSVKCVPEAIIRKKVCIVIKNTNVASCRSSNANSATNDLNEKLT